jgi:hypothetical protein
MRSWFVLFGLSCAILMMVAGCNGDNGVDDSGINDADAGIDAGDDAGIDAGDDAGTADGDQEGDQGGEEEPLPCQLDYDCPTGQVCRLGFCQPFEPECQLDDDCPGEEVCLEQICLEPGLSPHRGAIIFNEVLTDGDTDEDANGDGSIDSLQDEFIELVHVGNQDIDIDGWTLVDTDWGEFLPRHTFAAGTTLSPLDAVVVFGGGDPPDSTGTVTYLASNAQDPGDPYGLDLDDGGDLIQLMDENGLTVAVFAYGDEGGTPAVSDQSATRSPDLTGAFEAHSGATGAASAIFSPGTRVDGTPF